MDPTVSGSSAFEKALRSFQTGGVTYRDFLAEVGQQLAAGASPSELVMKLGRRESVEPLAEHLHAAVVNFITHWPMKPVVLEPETIVLQAEGEQVVPVAAYLAPLDVPVGRVLAGRFELTEVIGEGGMSRVFKAIDLRAPPAESPDFIAIKVLTRSLSDAPEAFPALRQEVARLSELVHPNIVRTFDCDRDEALVFITMEYLGGVSLYSRLHGAAANDGLHPGMGRAGKPIIRAIADALEYAHANQIVHGDLKPGNVLLTQDGGVKVIDFGIAELVARPRNGPERRGAARSRGAAALTPRYASPQLMARQPPTFSDDVYALACVAYELMSGVHPFDDGKGTQSLSFPPPMRPGLSSSQYYAVLGGLQFERRSRTPTVHQFITEFDAPPRAVWRGRAIGIAAAVIACVAIALIWFLNRASVTEVRQTAAAKPPVSTTAPATAPPAAVRGTVLRDCPTCAPMVVLTPGGFQQGAPSGEGDALSFAKPQHLVTLGYSFAMSTNDVTVAEFGEFVVATGRDMQGCEIYNGAWRVQHTASWKNPGFVQGANHPVTCVSWSDAVAYAQWLSAKTGQVYRLPSASEWEYAARSGVDTSQRWDAGGACGHANVADESAARRYPGWDVFACDDGFVNTSPVGSFAASSLGLNDMLGNVFQWTQDCWRGNYDNAPTDGSANMDGDCGQHELRGGSWFSAPKFVNPSYRNHFAGEYRTSSVGFRLVRTMAQ